MADRGGAAHLVRAVVALEPFGPPHRPAADGPPGPAHGLTAVPLEGLDGVPVLLVTAEASLLSHFDTEVRDYLTKAGATVDCCASPTTVCTATGTG